LTLLTAAGASLCQATTLFQNGAESVASIQDAMTQGLFSFLSQDGGGLVEVSTHYAHSGSKSFRFCYSQNEAQAAAEIRLPSGQKHVFFQWWELRERAGDFTGAHDYDWAGEKFNRLRSSIIQTTGVDYPLGWSASTNGQGSFGTSALDGPGNIGMFGNSTASNGADLFSFYYPMPRGEWHRFEVEINLGSVGTANGAARIWVDGVMKAEKTNVDLLPKNDANIDLIWLGGWYSGSSAPLAQSCRYVDDVIIANTGPIGGAAPSAVPEPPQDVTVQ